MSSYKLSDVVHEFGRYWVLRVPTGYDVYKVGATHSVRCAQIGWPNQEIGIARAKDECFRRTVEDLRKLLPKKLPSAVKHRAM